MKSYYRTLVLIAVLTPLQFPDKAGAAITIDMQTYTNSADQYFVDNGVAGDYQSSNNVEFRFSRDDSGSSGTGVINPFLNLQATPTEQAFNHDGSSTILDESLANTNSLLVDAVPTYNIDGNTWGEFLLDLNEPTATSDISLVQLQIFGATTAYATSDLSGEYSLSEIAAGVNEVSFAGEGTGDAALLFQLSDAITQYQILMDAALGAGGGSGTFNMRFFFDAEILHLAEMLGYTHLKQHTLKSLYQVLVLQAALCVTQFLVRNVQNRAGIRQIDGIR